MEGAGTARAPSEYEALIEKLESAQETEVVEQALVAAREHLGMDASYITTIDSRIQTIHAMVSDPETVNRYQGTVFPVEQTYCMRMLAGQIPNAVNLAIKTSRHGIVARVDGHCELPPGYLRTAVLALQETGAANVGCIMAAAGVTPFQQAVAWGERDGLTLDPNGLSLDAMA